MTGSAALTELDTTTGWQETLYRHLHAHPELSFEEEQTCGLISERLSQMGYAVQAIGGGVVGVLENGSGPSVLFRADIDALPVTETTGLDYASTVTATAPDGTSVGVMHACGHDMHITCALGVAQQLADHRDTCSGTYVALFQPADQAGAGAGIFTMASSLGSAIGVAISLAIFTGLMGTESMILGNTVEFIGVQDNVALRQAGMITMIWNLVIVVVAILAIMVTVPKGGGTRRTTAG